MECLKTFSVISKLQIVLVAEIPTPPSMSSICREYGRSTFVADRKVDMEQLLPLLNISANTTTTVLIVEPQSQTPWISNVSPLSGWNLAWNACLINTEQAVIESGPLVYF